MQATAAANLSWQAKLTAAAQQATADRTLLTEQHQSELAAATSRIEGLKREAAEVLKRTDCEVHEQRSKYATLAEEHCISSEQAAMLKTQLDIALSEQQALSSRHEAVSGQLETMRRDAQTSQQKYAQEQLSSSAELRKLRAELNEARQQSQRDAAAREAAWESEKQRLLAEVSRLQQLQHERQPQSAVACADVSEADASSSRATAPRAGAFAGGAPVKQTAQPTQGVPEEAHANAAAASGAASPTSGVMYPEVDDIQVSSWMQGIQGWQ